MFKFTKSRVPAFLKYGILPTELTQHLFYSKYVPVDFQEALASYKLLVWNKELMLHKFDGAYITRFNKQYLIVWDSIDTRGYFISEPLTSEWFLSFREPQPEYGLPNVCYVTRKYYK